MNVSSVGQFTVPFSSFRRAGGFTPTFPAISVRLVSGSFCFRPRDVRGAFRALHDARIACVPREGAIRLSPHLYNTAGEVARVMEVLGAAGVR